MSDRKSRTHHHLHLLKPSFPALGNKYVSKYHLSSIWVYILDAPQNQHLDFVLGKNGPSPSRLELNFDSAIFMAPVCCELGAICKAKAVKFFFRHEPRRTPWVSNMGSLKPQEVLQNMGHPGESWALSQDMSRYVRILPGYLAGIASIQTQSIHISHHSDTMHKV